MRYCTVCEESVQVRRKVTEYFWDRNQTYERDVCVKCGSELLQGEPGFDTNLKIPSEPQIVFSRLSEGCPRPE